jgi:hypothetical protein
MRMHVKKALLLAVMLISLRGVSQQLIQATLKLNSNPNEVEVWLRPNFSNSTQYLAQIAVPIAWPSGPPAVQPADITVTLDPTFGSNFGINYAVQTYPLAHNTCNTENYRVITLIRGGGGASNPQTWTSGQEFKLLTVTFPPGAPNGKVKIADYSADGGSDGQGYYYSADGNANYYISSISANNFYTTSGQSISGAGGCAGSGFVETNVAIPLACALPSVTINNITNTSANVTWPAVSGATGYEYDITGSSTPPGSGTATTATSFSPSGLTAATQYYVHVRTNCGGGSFSNWSTTNFTTATVACNGPTTPVISNIGITSADINWNAVGGATGYEYFLSPSSTAPGNAPGTGTTTTATSFLANGLTGGTQYYVFVRTDCGSGNFSAWVSASFTTQPPLCSPPSTPVVSNITISSARITWNVINGSSGYEYLVSLGSAMPGSSPGTGSATLSTNFSASQLTAGTTYFVFVRNNCGNGLFSDWTMISFSTLCEDPNPAIVSNITASSANINWNAVSGDVAYEFEVATSPNSPNTGTLTIGTSYSATGLLSGVLYYVHLRSKCSAGNYSNWVITSFTTICPTPASISITNITPTNATISWSPVIDAGGYQYLVTSSSTPPPSGAPTLFTNILATNLTEGTQYYVFVRTVCSPGVYSDWISKSFITPYPPCNVPSSLSVTGSSSNMSILWSAVNGSIGYEYAIGTSQNAPSSGIFTSLTTSQATGLAANTKYYIFVRTKCGTNRYSDWISTIYTTPCFKPSPFVIRNLPEAGSADLGWYAIKGALKYEYSILSEAVPPYGSSNFTTDTIVTATKLKPGNKYFLHVRTHCSPSSISEWSTKEFYTSGIVVHPIPANGIVTVVVYGVENNDEALALFDGAGKLLKVIKLTGTIATIDMKSYAAGIYYIRYGIGKEYMKRIVKL